MQSRTLEELLNELKDSQFSVSQPYGKEVRDFYIKGYLDYSTCLHLIAFLLERTNNLTRRVVHEDGSSKDSNL